MRKLIEEAREFLESQKDLYETAHVVHIKYDDPSGKGIASIRVPVNAKNPEHAKKKAMDKISRFPHPISGYKNAVVHRVETKKAVKEEVMSEAKSKWEPKSFPNTSKGAIDAFHHTAQKSLHAKDHSEYKISSVGPHAWLLSHPKKKYSAIVYPQGPDAHMGRHGSADFEMVDDHEKAMKHHNR